MPRHGREVHGYVHGHSVAERFDYDYSPEEVGEIAEPARLLPDRAEEVQARFNNSARDGVLPQGVVNAADRGRLPIPEWRPRS